MIDNLVHDIASISDPGESITNKECNYEGASLSRHFSGTGNYTSGTRPGRVQKTSSAESKFEGTFCAKRAQEEQHM